MTEITTNDDNQNAVCDLTYLRQFCEGDKARMKKYIGLYLKDVPSFIERINDANQHNDYQAIAAQVHSVKSKMLMMGMKKTGELAQKIELKCRQEGIKDKMSDDLAELIMQVNLSVFELNKSEFV